MFLFEIEQKIKETLSAIVKEEFEKNIAPEDIKIEHPNNDTWGDFSSNVALMIAGDIKQRPLDIAKSISYRISEMLGSYMLEQSQVKVFQKIESQPPGFINFTLSKETLIYRAKNLYQLIDPETNQLAMGSIRGQKILFEFTDPNPFKAFHIGHLMSNAVGESLSRLFEFFGAETLRANYQGDVGLHVAKSIWGLIELMNKDGINEDVLNVRPLSDRIVYLGKAYALGATEYKKDSPAEKQIREINYLVYIAAQELLQEKEGWNPLVDYKKYLNPDQTYQFAKIKNLYVLGRTWSLEGFEQFYSVLGTKFNFYYFESKVGEYGLKIVEKGLKEGVFEKDNGAVIFRGENFGLHNRVFINSYGLPTYETKDLGLAFLKYENFKYDKSFIVTANEVNEYFKVVIKAMEASNPELSSKTVHIGHGVMRFKSGKMSSRTGDVVSADSLISETTDAILALMATSGSGLNAEARLDIAKQLAVGAIKYSVLRQGIGKDIIYDRNRAISISGDTGPYLQYTHARANSILEKAPGHKFDLAMVLTKSGEIGNVEISLMRQLIQFETVLIRAKENLSPSIICDYLFELAQRFNLFYNETRILKSDGGLRNLRLQLVLSVKEQLKTGLWVLGISAPDRV